MAIVNKFKLPYVEISSLPYLDSLSMLEFDTLDLLNPDVRLDVAIRAMRFEKTASPSDVPIDPDDYNISLLFGYVRSFVKLAHLRDVAATAKALGMTRQTVSRHITELGNLLGYKLFYTTGAQSKLSEMGALWLPRAQEIFELGSVLQQLGGSNRSKYRSVQLPLRRLLHSEGAPILLKDFAKAWMAGSKSLECDSLADFSKHWITYERKDGIWRSRNIGDESALAKWFGKESARGSVGSAIPQMASGSELQGEVIFHLDSIYSKGGIDYSEIHCELPRDGHLEPVQAVWQRVTAELVDQTGSPVITTVVAMMDGEGGQ